jgi:uncharacterized membrane protein YoaK (UPF0700 family)
MERPASDRNNLKGTVVSLVLVAGYVDGYALHVLKNYVSFMSGNTTMAGLRAGEGRIEAALPPSLAIAAFLAGSFAGNWLAHSEYPYARRLMLAVTAVLLAFFIVLNFHNSLNIIFGVVILSSAMGLINPAVSRVGSEPLSLTFVTGTLNKIGGHLAMAVRHKLPVDAEGAWDTHLYRALLDAYVWIGFLTGAALAGLVVSHFGRLGLIPPCVILVIVALASHGDQ